MNSQIILAAAVLNLVAVFPAFGKSTAAKVTFASPCKITGQHGVDRWPAKTDSERAPADKSKITPIIPSQIFNWPGVGTTAGITRSSKRIPSEQRWFALTGRVTGVKVEADGDIHIELVDAN